MRHFRPSLILGIQNIYFLLLYYIRACLCLILNLKKFLQKDIQIILLKIYSILIITFLYVILMQILLIPSNYFHYCDTLIMSIRSFELSAFKRSIVNFVFRPFA